MSLCRGVLLWRGVLVVMGWWFGGVGSFVSRWWWGGGDVVAGGVCIDGSVVANCGGGLS